MCNIELHSAMKLKNNPITILVLLLSTVVIFSSASYAFAAAGTTGDATLQGCLNDIDGSCDTLAEWKSQNISIDALFFEEQSIPMRFDVTNLDAADYHTIVFEYDTAITSGGTTKHPFDFITSYNFTDSPNVCVGPDFVGGCVGSSFSIPDPTENTTYQTLNGFSQPETAISSLTSDQKQFWMFAPTGETVNVTNVEYVSEGLPGNNGGQTETTSVKVTFETSSSHVVGAFGAHLGSPNVWLHGAGEITGKNFIINCVSVNGNKCTDHVNFDAGIIVPIPDISISDVTKSEGNSGTTDFTFTLTRSGDLSLPSYVDYFTSDGTATTSDSDYNYINGTATFNVDSDTTTVTVTVNGDVVTENDETFFVYLTNPVHGTLVDEQGQGTITNDDFASLSINDVTQSEGNSGTTDFTFTVTLSAASALPVSVDFATADGTATTADSDYVANSGTLNFTGTAGETQMIIVKVNGDTILENHDIFYVNLSNPVNIDISKSQGIGTILDDDGAVSIDDVSNREGNFGTTEFVFTLTRNGDISEEASVDFATADGTATIADNDYITNSGTATFAANSNTTTITVIVIGDTNREDHETFTVNLSNPINTTISDNQGLGTIEDDEKNGDNQWDTRPTFGVSHEERSTQVVDNGFAFNGQSFSITDNHHTPFAQQSIEIGALNSFNAKVYASKGLKVQEFLFGVPQTGLGHLAEMRVEVWYDLSGNIDEIKVLQDTEVIDRSSLSVTHHKEKCQEQDDEDKCDVTSMSAVFLEPLKDKVMAIKAIDFKHRDQTTYLNEGFDISGDSLNPMATEMIPSPVKGEGLIKVTQNEKYSDYWTTEDGRIFEKNSFGSFKQINYQFKRFQDSGEANTRLHSGFEGKIQSEAQRAVTIFDASTLKSDLPESFSYDISIGDRITDEVIQEMIIQEHIAQKKMQELYEQQTRWN